MEVFPYIEEKYGFIVDKPFIDIGVPEDLERVRKLWV
jgi:NDP-sugar pyrophosphorylase family protein